MIEIKCHGRVRAVGRASFQRSLKEVQLFDVGSNPGRSIRWEEKSKMRHSWAKMEISEKSRPKKDRHKIITQNGRPREDA